MAHEFFRDVTVETLSPDLQPDQQPTRWDNHVDERGEGLILRGGRMIESEGDRKPHLTAQDAYELLRNSPKVCRSQHGHYPARVVLHKTSRFDRNEMAGFHKASRRARYRLCRLYLGAKVDDAHVSAWRLSATAW